MQIRVLFFATFKERAGTKDATIEIEDGMTVQALKMRLAEQFPGLAAGMKSALVSVNREFAFDEDAVPGGAEVAVFPPVSGG